MDVAYDGRQVVGMDLHRRRSVLVRMTADGQQLETARITNSPAALRAVLARCGQRPLVVLEATYGWYWAADVLEQAGAEVRLAHPLGVKAFSYRRVKNDERDASDLADLARMGRLPEAWIAPPAVRAVREVVRYRHKLVQQRTSCKDQVHAVLAKCGVPVTHSDIFGRGGGLWLDQLVLPAPYAAKVASLRALIGVLDGQVAVLGAEAAAMLAAEPGYAALRELPGIGPVLAAVICAEIGDVTRFRRPGQLCSWAGLTPRHHESDTKVIRGHVSKQGSRMLRWALTEAIQHQPASARPRQAKEAIIARRGKEARNIAKTAAARVLLTQVFYAMRDGHVRRASIPAA
ncbi:MAG TPA: IS110 family transposase [Streptosporangiaceae bacterium]|nr:IS110 family transposase [Streptosporangiaceae bacterium]HEX5288362.1 IS110 family transposase [Streptosporangiaceae bacterium]